NVSGRAWMENRHEWAGVADDVRPIACSPLAVCRTWLFLTRERDPGVVGGC
ncbi:MAG: hypothetical protein ACI841_005445, partial [Planctomycetota bacterium]